MACPCHYKGFYAGFYSCGGFFIKPCKCGSQIASRGFIDPFLQSRFETLKYFLQLDRKRGIRLMYVDCGRGGVHVFTTLIENRTREPDIKLSDARELVSSYLQREFNL